MMVDAVVLFEQETPLELIQTLKPDVLVKGGDYTIESIVGAEDVMQNGGKVEIIPLIPGVSTTLIAERIHRL
jgi:D-beta-D-heptose 7-phosphate kinase/D-beta-D-heptose 1-phosphate adenosyltransferase